MRARQALRAEELGARRATLQEITAATRTPYLLAKDLPAFRGVYTDQDGDTLFVPLVDAHGKQWSEQYIRGDGTKRLASEARKERARARRGIGDAGEVRRRFQGRRLRHRGGRQSAMGHREGGQAAHNSFDDHHDLPRTGSTTRGPGCVQKGT